MKKCSVCCIEKDLNNFHKSKGGKLGVKARCKECIKIDSAAYELKNKEIIKIKKAIIYKDNKEKVIKRVGNYAKNNIDKISKYQKEYRKINRVKLNKYSYDRNRLDKIFYLKSRLRKAIIQSINKKGFVKILRTEDIIGCDFDFFINYIEAQFTAGMNWKNIHIDHIKPLFCAKTEIEVIELNHYTNLQPLFALDNLKKGSKIINHQLKLI